MSRTQRLSTVAMAISALFVSMSVCAAPAVPEFGPDIRVDTDLTQFDSTQSSYVGSNIAFRFEGQKLTLDPKGGSLTFDSNRRGICVYSAKDKTIASHLVIGTASTEDITVNVKTDTATNSDAVGIVILRLHADANGNLSSANDVGVPSAEINGKNLTVNVHNDGTGEVRGINIQNNTTTSEEFASLVINSENTVINVTGNGPTVGMSAMSQGRITVNGNLEVNADKAIIARGDAIVTINKNADKTVKLNGDIDFTYSESTSGTKVDAVVDITLSGANSYWVGNASTSTTSGTPPEGYSDVHGLNVSLKDQAQWTPTVMATTATSHNIAINSMRLDDGVINVSKELVQAGQDVRIESLGGAGGTIKTFVDAQADGTLVAGKVSIGELENAASMRVMASNVTADDVTAESAKKTLALLGQTLTVAGSSAEADETTVTAVVGEGAVKGAITQTFDTDGVAQGEVAEQANTKLTAFGSVAALSAFQWRHDMNDLTKRMGELRTSPEGIGSWVRLYGSEQEYGALQAKNTSIQVGSDVDVGMGWKVGAAFSYTDGNATYADGDADNKAYGLGIYGTWMAENGQFVDLIAKYSRLDTDFALNGMNGGFDNNAYSVSAEYGWHLKLGEYAFVEPQAELTYGQVLGDTFTTGNGVKVEQDDFDAFIGRIGVRGGFHFPDNKGVVYVRASVLHDFEGESTAVASLVNDSSVRSGIHEDLGGTWYEVGVGANFNVTNNTYTYVDLEKTSGGEVKENWRWNVGMRYVW